MLDLCGTGSQTQRFKHTGQTPYQYSSIPTPVLFCREPTALPLNIFNESIQANADSPGWTIPESERLEMYGCLVEKLQVAA